MTNEQFDDVYLPKYNRSIVAIARKIAAADENLYTELVQVGRIALWKFNIDAVRTNEQGCVNSHLRNRMIDFVRSERGRSRAIALDDDSFRPKIDMLYIDEAGNVTEAQMDRADRAPNFLYDTDADYE